MNLPPVNSRSHPGFSSKIPAIFVSLEEARNSLDYLCNLCIQKSIDFEHIETLKSGNESQEHRVAWDRDRQSQKNQCSRWSDAFQAFLNANVGKMVTKAMQGKSPFMALLSNALLSLLLYGIVVRKTSVSRGPLLIKK